MNYLTSAVLIAALAACTPEATPAEVAARCAPERAAWILQCIENANPHSDEEPEDSTLQCERTSIRLFCGPTCYLRNRTIIACQLE